MITKLWEEAQRQGALPKADALFVVFVLVMVFMALRSFRKWRASK